MSSELIKVTVQNDQQLVSARELYKGLEIKTRFSLWVKQNFDDFEQGMDFTSVVTTTEVQNNGGIQQRALQDYALTIDMAKQLCLLSRTKKGKEYREYLIQVEKNWNNPDMIVQRALAIQNEKIKSQEQKIKRLVIRNVALEDTNTKQAQKIARDADDVVFAKAIRYSHHAIPIGELAEILTQNGFVIGRNQLFSIAERRKIFIRFQKQLEYSYDKHG